MKQVTIIVDDEELYRAVEAEATRQGRSVQDAVAEALGDWLRGPAPRSAADQERAREALRRLEVIRSAQPIHSVIEDTLWDLRDERS